MHLRAIKLRGFKSFPDPVEVRLQPGVAVVVGPNHVDQLAPVREALGIRLSPSDRARIGALFT